MPLFSTAIAIGSALGGLISGNKAKKASKAANAAVRASNKLKNRQAKRAFLRNFRQAQAAAVVGGVASGVSGESSTVQGQLSSQGTQTTTAISEFAQFDKFGDVQTAALNRQAGANFASSVFGAVGSFATSPGGSDFLDTEVGPKLGIPAPK